MPSSNSAVPVAVSDIPSPQAVSGAVFVVGATNRRDLIDEALLRPGRLDQHIHVPLPDRDARREIIQVSIPALPDGQYTIIR